MRVAVLIDLPTLISGVAASGLPARMVALSEGMAALGVEVELLVADRSIHGRPVVASGVSVTAIHPTDWERDDLEVEQLLRGRVDFVICGDARTVLRWSPVWRSRADAQVIYDLHDDDESVAHEAGLDDSVARSRGAMQRAALSSSDGVFIVSRDDRTLVDRMAPSQRVAVVPLMYRPIQRAGGRAPLAEGVVISFLGNGFYVGNRVAIRRLMESIVPLISRVCPELRIEVIGQVPDDLRAWLSGYHEVEVCGFVGSLEGDRPRGQIGVAPTTLRSGMKCKVLTYLACGLLPVGSPSAWSGWESVPSLIEAMTADNDDEFAARVVALAREPLAARMRLLSKLQRTASLQFGADRVARHAVYTLSVWNAERTDPGGGYVPRAWVVPSQWVEDHRELCTGSEGMWTRPGVAVRWESGAPDAQTVEFK